MRRTLLTLLALCAVACQQVEYDPEDPAVGPGGMVGNDGPITDGNFAGGNDPFLDPRAVTPPSGDRPPNCDGACVAYCETSGLDNPVNKGLCRSLWGVGLAPMPVIRAEACRRLYVDMLGRFPSAAEVEDVCGSGNWGEAVKRLMADPGFVLTQQKRHADRFLYSTEVVSLERVYDMDRLVGKLSRGEVPYDLYAAVASAHPVLTRRYEDPGDMVEALFLNFMGRPPFDNERADMARMYRLWHRGYYDHPYLNMRLPDAFIRFRCLDEETGQVDPNAKGECTSVLWGYNEIIFTPDMRAARSQEDDGDLTMWSGHLTPEEWRKLQAPGRVLATRRTFWERAVEDVVEQYLGYNLTQQVPEVREELVDWLLQHNGDIRSVHYAVATSMAYLQSNAGDSGSPYRWTYGPINQVESEVWIDSMARAVGYALGACDHRLSHPQTLVEAGSLSAYRLLNTSRWDLNEEGEVDMRYAELARTLGGCPENVVGGRFRVVSILTTATQMGFVASLCNPTRDPEVEGAAVEKLLPEGVGASRALTVELAEQIATHQYRLFLGRPPNSTELAEVREAATVCANTLCSAEEFARPACFALLSSAEMLFY